MQLFSDPLILRGGQYIFVFFSALTPSAYTYKRVVSDCALIAPWLPNANDKASVLYRLHQDPILINYIGRHIRDYYRIICMWCGRRELKSISAPLPSILRR